MEPIDTRSSSVFGTTAELPAEIASAFLRKVYGWMFIGLAVTAVGGVAVAGSPALLQHIVANQFLFFGLILPGLGPGFYLSARGRTAAPRPAMTLFRTYS